MRTRSIALFMLCAVMLLSLLAGCNTDVSGKDTQENGADLPGNGESDANGGDADDPDTPSNGEPDTDPDQSDPGEGDETPGSEEDGEEIQYAQLVARVTAADNGAYTLLDYKSDVNYETMDWAQFDAASFTEGTQTYQMLPDTNCRFYRYNESGETTQATAEDITQDCFLRIQYGEPSKDVDTQADTLYIIAYEIYILPAGDPAES